MVVSGGTCGNSDDPADACGFKGYAVVAAAAAAIPITFWFYFDQLYAMADGVLAYVEVRT